MPLILPYHLELLWYWEGPVRRHFKNSPVWRSSRELSLWQLRRGSIELNWRGGRRHVYAGHWVIPTPLLRNEQFSPDAEVRSLRFVATYNDGSLLLCPSTPWVLPAGNGSELHRAVGRLRKFVRNDLRRDLEERLLTREILLPPDVHFALLARAADCFSALLHELKAAGLPGVERVPRHPAVSAALKYLADRDLSRPLRESEIARHAGISLPHLRRLFRSQTGFTLKTWDAQRIEDGVRLILRTGQASAKEAAAAFGFSSPSHFSRWFRLRFQQVPSEFRQKLDVHDPV